jgi:hypothetical protein
MNNIIKLSKDGKKAALVFTYLIFSRSAKTGFLKILKLAERAAIVKRVKSFS